MLYSRTLIDGAKLGATGLELFCPGCREPLRAADDSVSCDRCGNDFLVVDEAPMFVGGNSTRTLSTSQQVHAMSALLIADVQTEIEPTLRRTARLAGISAENARRMMGAAAAGWKFLLPLRPQTRVLELGCGWGAAALNLRQNVCCVVGVDRDPAKIAFARLRARHLGAENCSFVCLSEAEFLPFAENAFDVVILSGDAHESMADRPQAAHSAFDRMVAEARRVLSDTGSLMIVDECRRRWRLRDLVPKPVGRAKLVPFLTSLVPRPVTRPASDRQRQWQQALREQKAHRTDQYALMPCREVPIWLWPAQQKSSQVAESFLRPTTSRKARLRQRLRGWRHAMLPSVVATRASFGSNTRSLMDRMVETVRGGGVEVDPERLMMRCYRINSDMGMATAVLTTQEGENDGLVLRLTMDRRGEEQIRNEAAVLQRFHHRENGEQIAAFVPRVLFEGQCDQIHFSALSILPGRSVENIKANGAAFQRAFEEASSFAVRLHKATARPDSREIAQRARDQAHQLEPLARSCRQRRALRDLAESIANTVDDFDLPTVIGHGDFKLGNCLYRSSDATLCGVLDWGASRARELPLYDLTFSLVGYLRARRGWSAPQVLGSWLATNVPPGGVESWLADKAAAMEIEWNGRLSRLVAQYQWLGRMAPLTTGDEMFRFDGRYLNDMFGALPSG